MVGIAYPNRHQNVLVHKPTGVWPAMSFVFVGLIVCMICVHPITLDILVSLCIHLQTGISCRSSDATAAISPARVGVSHAVSAKLGTLCFAVGRIGQACDNLLKRCLVTCLRVTLISPVHLSVTSTVLPDLMIEGKT